jgi:hypothetical protein
VESQQMTTDPVSVVTIRKWFSYFLLLMIPTS